MPKTFKDPDAFTKPTLAERRADPKGTKWPSIGYFLQQQEEQQKRKAARLQSRFWASNGEYISRVLVRFGRWLNA